MNAPIDLYTLLGVDTLLRQATQSAPRILLGLVIIAASWRLGLVVDKGCPAPGA